MIDIARLLHDNVQTGIVCLFCGKKAGENNSPEATDKLLARTVKIHLDVTNIFMQGFHLFIRNG